MAFEGSSKDDMCGARGNWVRGGGGGGGVRKYSVTVQTYSQSNQASDDDRSDT